MRWSKFGPIIFFAISAVILTVAIVLSFASKPEDDPAEPSETETPMAETYVPTDEPILSSEPTALSTSEGVSTTKPTATVKPTATSVPTATNKPTMSIAPTPTIATTPSDNPTQTAVVTPTILPTNSVTDVPTEGPTHIATPTEAPPTSTIEPTNSFTATPTIVPTPTEVPNTPTNAPTITPTTAPTPTITPIPLISVSPTIAPSPTPVKYASTYKSTKSGLYILDDCRVVELYGSAKANIQKYATALNTLASKKQTVRVYSMIIPNTSAFYWNRASWGMTSNQEADIEYAYSLLNDRVVGINAYGALSRHTNEDIYLRTDHHWSYLGAYYAAEEAAWAMGFSDNFTKISGYTKHERTGYVGSLVSYYGAELEGSETFTYFTRDYNSKVTFYWQNMSLANSNGWVLATGTSLSASYLMCLGGDSYISKITLPNNSTGRTLIYIKDSYGLPAAQYLLEGFDTIYTVDYRYAEINIYDFIDQVGATDVILANAIAATGGSVGVNEVYNFLVK